MKLTERQQTVLDEMRAGAIAYFMPRMGRLNPNSYWFLSTTNKRCTKEVDRLIGLGLVETVGSHNDKTAIAKS